VIKKKKQVLLFPQGYQDVFNIDNNTFCCHILYLGKLFSHIV